jgi:hypothetical protein
VNDDVVRADEQCGIFRYSLPATNLANATADSVCEGSSTNRKTVDSGIGANFVKHSNNSPLTAHLIISRVSV